MNNINLLTRGFQLSCFFVFAGRSWQHIVWDAPYRTIFWDESLLSEFITTFTNMSWHEYATSPVVDGNINMLKFSVGVIYGFLAIFSLFAHKNIFKKMRWLLLVGGMLLFSLALLYFKEKFFQVGQLFEYSIQFSSPFFLYYILSKEAFGRNAYFLLKLSVALTFTCHGLYALGYYPQPGHFVGMTLRILHIDESTARLLLKSFGWIDLMLSVLIFVPKAARWALAYAAFWGFATALARVWANIHFDFLYPTLKQWTFEMVMRIPHGLFPLLLISPLSLHFRSLLKKEKKTGLQSGKLVGQTH